MMNGSNDRLTPEEEKTARALLEKDLEGMIAMMFLQRRDTDREVVDSVERLSKLIEDLSIRVSLMENRLHEVTFWMETINQGVRESSSSRPASGLGSSRSRRTPKIRAEGENDGLKDGPFASPRRIIRQKTMGDIHQQHKQQEEI